MCKKAIIGLMSENDYFRDKVAMAFCDIGFSRYSIRNKIKEFARYLDFGDNLGSDTINKIRDAGYCISKKYWINLLFANIPKEKMLIVIDDLRLEDIIVGVIHPYIIGHDNHEKCEFEIINPNSDNIIDDISKKINNIIV